MMKYVNTVLEVFNTVSKMFSGAIEQAKQNKAELIRGSVLDHLNHPSYTPEEVSARRAKALAREKALERLEKKYA